MESQKARRLTPSPLAAEAKEDKQAQASDRLFNLPDDLLKNTIGSFLDPCDKARLRGASTFFNQRFNGEGLLQAVVDGNLETLQAILSREVNNDLLLKAYTVTDRSGRRIRQTAYQAAVAAEDEEMAQLIKKHLLKQPDGAGIVAKQQVDLDDKAWEWRQQEDMAALKTVLDVIGQSTVTAPTNLHQMPIMDETCEQAINTFRQHLDNCKNGVITSGRHWNAGLLEAAFEQYCLRYSAFGGEPKSPRGC